jgi:hypothetical protein
MSSSWPRLDFAADRPTAETLHALLQLIGKLPLRLHPWLNHGWHVALRISPRGAVTRGLPAGDRTFTVELDVLSACIAITCDNGSVSRLPVAGLTIAEVQARLSQRLAELHLPAPLHGAPNEVPSPVPFREDHAPREWDEDAARRLHGAFLCADRAFNAFRSLYRGKSSPSHLFWGSFDLAVTRFSGRPAPPHPGGIPALPDEVTREAYSDEVISAGFWPGSAGVLEEAAFYAYAYPAPPALGEQAVTPAAAFWHAGLGEFLLPYEALRSSADPDAAVQAFLRSTYEVAGRLLQWPEGLASAMQPAFGRPPSVGLASV